jgi:hypothetical protein
MKRDNIATLYRASYSKDFLSVSVCVSVSHSLVLVLVLVLVLSAVCRFTVLFFVNSTREPILIISKLSTYP